MITYSPINKLKTYSGITDSSGIYSITYTESYVNTPIVISTIQTTKEGCTYKLINSNVNGFSIMVEEHQVVNVVGVDVLSSGYSPSAGVTVNVLVIPV